MRTPPSGLRLPVSGSSMPVVGMVLPGIGILMPAAGNFLPALSRQVLGVVSACRGPACERHRRAGDCRVRVCCCQRLRRTSPVRGTDDGWVRP